jgi:CheY-like chemotaxis protein
MELPWDAARRVVLVVEDDPGIADVAAAALEGAGYAVAAAANGAEALARVGEVRPAAILLDVRMPVMDGPTFVARYRRGPGPHAPIVAFAASAAGLADARAAGVDALLAKPFDVDELVATVARLAG